MGVRIAEALIRRLALIIVLVLAALFAAVVWTVRDFMPGARLFPLYVASAGLVLIALDLASRVAVRATGSAADRPEIADLGVAAEEQTPEGYGRALVFFAWILGYYACLALAGGGLGSALFVAAFLGLHYRVGWLRAGAFACGIYAFVHLLAVVLALRFPRGLATGWLPGVI